MNSTRIGFTIAILSVFLSSVVSAHETRILGTKDGAQYAVTVGMLNEPVFTEVRTGLDLMVRTAADEQPVEGLETSLQVDITAPTGETRTVDIRPQHGAPGRYTADYILTVPGTYQIRIRGFIGALEIDETYPREVADVADIRFP